MSGKSYDSFNAVRVACPFYKGEEPQDVRCEGLKNGGALVNHFANPKHRDDFMAKFCQSVKGCEHCPIHRMHSQRYQQRYA